eukprot:766522-Hanusia_phi.AAC.2
MGYWDNDEEELKKKKKEKEEDANRFQELTFDSPKFEGLEDDYNIEKVIQKSGTSIHRTRRMMPSTEAGTPTKILLECSPSGCGRRRKQTQSSLRQPALLNSSALSTTFSTPGDTCTGISP